ncbi:MAG: hypothetical protein HYU39_09620 [Thaumarchaeota archaeon]|nr:hypothetical protein [Nitrososphaerota archaeon]
MQSYGRSKSFNLGQGRELRETLEDNSLFALRFDTFSNIEDGLVDVFGQNTAEVIIFQAGKSAGIRYYDRILMRAGRKEAILDAIGPLKATRNWGEIAFENLDSESAKGKIIVNGCFERRGEPRIMGCPFFRGYLAGFLSRYFNTEIGITEEVCSPEKCVFLFAPEQNVSSTQAKS